MKKIGKYAGEKTHFFAWLLQVIHRPLNHNNPTAIKNSLDLIKYNLHTTRENAREEKNEKRAGENKIVFFCMAFYRSYSTKSNHSRTSNPFRNKLPLRLPFFLHDPRNQFEWN